MPIYEFRCVECGHVQEILVFNSSDSVEMKCAQCRGEILDRIMSTTSYAMGSSSGENTSPSVTTKSCGPGKSCTTLQLPGHTR